MTDPLKLILLAASAARLVRSQCSTPPGIDLSEATNPSLRVQWANALGIVFTPQDTAILPMVPAGATDQDQAPFPGGFLRLQNVMGTAHVNDGASQLDLIVTVPPAPIIHGANHDSLHIGSTYTRPTGGGRDK